MKARYQDRNTLAATAAESWFNQYRSQIEDPEHYHYSRARMDTYKELLQLGSNPSPDDVDEVIGHVAWTSMRCSGCMEKAESVVVVGQRLDHDSATAALCKDCLADAVKAFEEKRTIGVEEK